MNKYIKSLLQDKNGKYNTRDTASVFLLIAILISWTGQQFYKYTAPDYLLYCLCGLFLFCILLYTAEQKNSVKKKTESESEITKDKKANQ